MWLQTEAGQALSFLKKILEETHDADGLMLNLCNTLSTRDSREGPYLINPDYVQPEPLGTFIPLVYRHIRTDEDIDRFGGGVYFPTARDEAQRFRDGLLELLVKSPDAEADIVLETLANEPVASINRMQLLPQLRSGWRPLCRFPFQSPVSLYINQVYPTDGSGDRMGVER